MTTYQNTGGQAGRILSLVIGGSCLGFLGLVLSCSSPVPASPTSAPNPTVQAAATEVGGAVRAVATAQGGIAQPTLAAAQTQVVSSAQGAATALAPTAQNARAAVATAIVGQATQVAPTVSAARTEIGSTVAVAGTSGPSAGATAQSQQATSVTIAREATATALAPRAQAVATRVAPTVQAAGTQVVAAVGTLVAASPVHVTNVNVGPTDTTVSVQNSGSAPMTLAGWTLLMGPDLSVVLSDITVKGGQTRQLHFSQGTDTDSDVYVGFGSTVARASLQPGARVVLISPADQIASVYPII